MKIYSLNKLHWISQGFGKLNTAPAMLPLYQSLGLQGHDGLDFSVNCKDYQVKHGGKCEPVYCNVEGDGQLTVTKIQKDDTYGWGLIAVDDRWNKFLWWHFDYFNPILLEGSKLNPGDIIGYSGNTGYSTGAHCHFGWYPYGADYQNGYHGAEDCTPYYDNRFILDVENQIGIIRKLILLYQQLIALLKR